MNEIYWITRLDSINSAVILLLVLGGCIIFGSIIGVFVTYCDFDRDESNVFKRILKWSIPINIVLLFSYCLIPTTKEAFLIYGVGGTIDYIKNDSIANQIPQKAIVALDKWVDELTKEENDNERRN